MKPTTRSRILDHIRKHQTSSVREFSQVLGLTGANIRHHLAILEANDQIEVVSRRQEGRGRPAQIYGSSRHVLGDGLDKLAGTLLDVWLDSLTDEKLEAGLKAVAKKFSVALDAKAPVMQRLVRTIERLNELHYQARWEAGAMGPRLILGQCPYQSIIAKHPELCRMDAYLLEQCSGSPVEQTAKLQPSTKGYPFCVFRVSGNR